MQIGVPKETLPGENRAALIPSSIAALTKAGLDVLIETGAGAGSPMPRGALIPTAPMVCVGAAIGFDPGWGPAR